MRIMASRAVTGFGAFILAISGTPAPAANVGVGYVLGFDVLTAAVVFNVSGPAAGSKPAGVSVLQRFAVDTTTAAGQAMFATALRACLAQQRVYVVGLGHCNT
ncbi:hypothetical protein ACFSUK_16470 [Sphingobium scionense]|uniref:Hydrogenase/urease accessory protein HupE n=1 Tax=Sphingobium scionense TaxID=1404341 RepID=A0A7W6LWW9_9SPHN|nr:hypothetical protein [Sphingobium scionense]MBB4151968.1 hydrogenase/urease accessory protein HupE [Sphingobium scionense]